MDLLDIARYVGALLLVLGLIGVAGLAARRFGLPGLARPASARRLKVVESLMVSPRQRLVLLRRDDVEHLVMLCPDGATVVEASITPPPAEPPA
ncbi:MAG TPA: flagellar biosynthetic protein FliO [Rhizomicrobium sp.]